MKPWRNSCSEARRVLCSARNLRQESSSHRGILPSLRESMRNETGIFRAGKCPGSSLSHSSALQKKHHIRSNQRNVHTPCCGLAPSSVYLLVLFHTPCCGLSPPLAPSSVYLLVLFHTPSTSELYQPSEHRLLVKLVPTSADRGLRVVSVADPYS
jgi:hypothetical protein